MTQIPTRNLGLAARLQEGGAPHAIRAEGLAYNVQDTIARLRVIDSDRAQVEAAGETLDLIIGRETRLFCERNPDALWVIDLAAADGRGTAVAFAPPRSARLRAPVPVKVPANLIERLGEVDLRMKDDLSRIHPAARRPEVAVIGQRAIAALDQKDGLSVTWWLSSGGALELRVELSAGRGSLHLVDLVFPPDARNANCGPNTLLFFQPGASLILVPEDDPADVAVADLEPFRPARSPLFDAWARYTALDLQERENRENARRAHPLTYRRGRQREGRWVAEATLGDEAIKVWLGADASEGRIVRVQQPVARVDGDTEEGPYSLESAKLRGPGLLEFEIKTRPGLPILREEGVLHARKDKGEQRRRERERSALDTIGRGSAACVRLVDLLGRPESATPPAHRPLPLAPAERLDEHQLRAVQLIVGCEDLVVIQGPPGTGKTRVIIEAIRQIEAAHRGHREPVRILVSSVQNEAVANVVERLAVGGSMVVRLVRRDARDEDEGFDFAAWSRKQGESVVASLEGRLSGSRVAATLATIREAESEVNEIRGWWAAGQGANEVVLRALRALAHRENSLLGSALCDEAARLADLFEARASAEGTPEVGSEPPLPPVPEAPDAVSAWWTAVEAHCPLELRPTMAAAVLLLTEAAATVNPIRRESLLGRRWPAFRSEAAQFYAYAASGTFSVAIEPAPIDPIAAADGWMARALADLRELRAHIEERPEAVALRFLQALREDPRAWPSIVERHGNAVAATCSMSARAQRDPGDAYDWVIVDEAARASPFELLVPMVQGRRVVLIGDHRQLPPTVDDAIVRRADVESDPGGDARVDISYETLFGALFTLVPSGCRARLEVQYRMHGDIGALVDTLFYRPHPGESLASAFTGARARERELPWDVLGRRPLNWVEVAPTGPACTEENRREADQVVELLRLYAAAGSGAGDVAVICPYGRQRALLKRLLANEPALQRISQLKTIDAVQGREYPVVILCLVRTDRRAGFLASPNRLNVAVSRAQRQLVVVGAAQRFLDSESVRSRAPALHALVSVLFREHRVGRP